MGQKVHPFGFRVGVTEVWSSRWFRKKNYAEQLHQDLFLRKHLAEKLSGAGISNIVIERAANSVRVTVKTARPGLIIGKKGKDIEDLRQDLKKIVGREVVVNIVEVRKPDIDAKLVAENIASQLMRRVAFRRVMKDSVARAMRMGAEGIKVAIAGRLGGAEIARTEWTREGRVPLHTLRAQIDYALAEAHTTYGVIGVKVWIFRGERVEEEEPVNLVQASAGGN